MVDQTKKTSDETAVAPVDGFSETELSELNSMSDVLAAMGGQVTNVSEVLGNGFSVLDDKSRLIDTEFVIVKYGVQPPSKKTGKPFATMHVITRAGEKWIVNDGSTGLMEQLAEIAENRGSVSGTYVPRGLRVSEYDYEDPKDGTVKAAKTFYLNTAK